jgi:hypothetical protein
MFVSIHVSVYACVPVGAVMALCKSGLYTNMTTLYGGMIIAKSCYAAIVLHADDDDVSIPKYNRSGYTGSYVALDLNLKRFQENSELADHTFSQFAFIELSEN